jgi:hypothetical protein
MEILRMLHDSFTTLGPDGERAGGWMVTLFRVGKLVAAGLSKRAKNFVVDLGTDGGNGKGFLWCAIKHTFGQLCGDLPLSMLAKDPPPAGAATPELFELRGLRLTCTPESEKSMTIRSMWLKAFGDSSTVYTGRGLYMESVRFKIPALFAISSNMQLNLTSVDGGVMRRSIGISWPVAFRANPQGNEERPCHAEDTESDAFYTPLRVAGYLFFVLECLEVFFNKGQGLAYRPPQVRAATFVNISSEYAIYIRGLIDTMEECPGPAAATKKQFLDSARARIAALEEVDIDQVKPAAVEKAAETLVVFKLPSGNTKKVQRISTRQYLRFV